MHACEGARSHRWRGQQVLDKEEEFMPEIGELDMLDEEEEAYDEKMTKKEQGLINAYHPTDGFLLAMKTTVSKKHPKEVARYTARLQDEFIKEKRAVAARKIRSEQRLMARIMGNWAGMGVKSVFERWAKYTRKRRRIRQKVAERRKNEERHKQIEEWAAKELMQAEVDKWKPHLDPFSDRVRSKRPGVAPHDGLASRSSSCSCLFRGWYPLARRTTYTKKRARRGGRSRCLERSSSWRARQWWRAVLVLRVGLRWPRR